MAGGSSPPSSTEFKSFFPDNAVAYLVSY